MQTNQIIQIILLVVAIIALGVYNGQMINWGNSRVAPEHQKWSKAWHRTGFIIRLLIAAVVFLIAGWGWLLIVGFLAYPVYNGIINHYLGTGILYIGKTAWMDRNIPHWMHYTFYVMILAAGVWLIALGL